MSDLKLSKERAHQLANFLSPFLLGEKLSLSSYELLDVLVEIGQKKIKLADLIQRLHTSGLMFGCNINQFESLGLIEIEREHQWDQSRVSIQKRGLDLYDKIQSKPEVPLEETISKKINPILKHLNIWPQNYEHFLHLLFQYYRDVIRVRWIVLQRKEHWTKNDFQPSDDFVKTVSEIDMQLLEKAVEVIETKKEYQDLRFLIHAFAFTKKVCETLVVGGEYYDFLSNIKGINLLLDTNVIISALIPSDPWYETTYSIFESLTRITNHSDIKIRLYIAEESLDELARLIAGSEISVKEILDFARDKKQIDKVIQKDMASSLVVDYFRGRWPTYHDYSSNLVSKLQTMIIKYNIHRQNDKTPIEISTEDKINIERKAMKYIRDNNIPKKPVNISRAIHDTYIITFAYMYKDINKDEHVWDWSYDRSFPGREANIFGQHRCAVTNLYLVSAISGLDLTISGIQDIEPFKLRLFNTIESYYFLIFNKYKADQQGLNQLIEALDIYSNVSYDETFDERDILGVFTEIAYQRQDAAEKIFSTNADTLKTFIEQQNRFFESLSPPDP